MVPQETPPGGPPKPPEWEKPSTRAIIIAMLGIYADEMGLSSRRAFGDSGVLLRTPIMVHHKSKRTLQKLQGGDSQDDATPETAQSRYEYVRNLLNIDLESQTDLQNLFHDPLIKKRLVQASSYKEETPDILGLLFGVMLKDAEERGVSSMFEKIKQVITDTSFTNRFGYESIVVGLHNEVLALLPSSKKDTPPLYLGMTVSYPKRLVPSGYTGPLAGKGRITAFLLPSRENDIILDHVIQLEVKTEEGTVPAFLAPDEVSVG